MPLQLLTDARRVSRAARVAAILVVTLATVPAPAVSARADQAKQSRRPSGSEWDQVRPLFKLVEDAAAGKPAPADVTLAWQCHFLNAEAGVVFVPFTARIERGAFTSLPVAMYLRVVKRGGPAPAPGPQDALAQYPFEDAAIFDRIEDGRISRAFTAPPGEYDVYVALIERATVDAPSPRIVVLKQAVTVPDLQTGLAMSSIIVADKIEVDPGTRRLDFEEQLDEPYALWGTRITPAMATSFGRRQAFSVTFLIYNTAAAAADKPDVEVQYTVHRQTGATETFFTRTKPELFNAQTLRPEFSVTAGNLIVAGQTMPLARFPDGNYRLEITATDKAANTSVTRDVRFTVAGS